jgi:APA family basic amino acid/polyamine antiporter
MYLVPAEELIKSTAPIALAASKVFGAGGTLLITVGALVSTVGALNAIILTAGQMPLAVAKDGLLPRVFSRVGTYGTPVVSLLISGSVVSILLFMNYNQGLVAAFTFMALLSTLSTLLAYAFCAVAEFYFLRTDERSFEKSKAIVLSSLAFIYSLFAIWGAGVEIVAYSFLLILIGTPIFVLSKNTSIENAKI